ncbi:MAG: nucleotidyltransferase domain-containing protein [Bacteroidales bacterium]|nr:nucleotidyltransferase domain-containing protein [Bacteroidales bacterium]
MSKQEILTKIKKTAHTIIPEGGIVILFGSQARGTANEDSDWDILILLDKKHITKDDYDQIGYPFDKLGWEMNTVINPIMYTKQKWDASSFTPFYKNVMKEGIIL